jgi:multidrug resistance efflux pump
MAVQERAAWDVAWEAALDELELSLEESERLLRATPADAAAAELVVRQDGTSVSAWTPPSLATPLPAEMLDRAQTLLARQAELIGQTMAAMSRTRLDIEMVGRVSGTPRSGRSVGAVYLDVRA